MTGTSQTTISASRVRAWWRYARAASWAARGANIGRRVAVGRDCRIERPSGVSIGNHATLEHSVWLKLVDDQAQASIGAWTFLGTGTELDIMQSVVIGEHTLIAPGCFITDHTHRIASGSRIDQQGCLVAPVVIGSDVWLGAKVCVLPGVTIGDGAVVAAASVVRENVAPGTVVAGVPARPVGMRTRCE